MANLGTPISRVGITFTGIVLISIALRLHSECRNAIPDLPKQSQNLAWLSASSILMLLTLDTAIFLLAPLLHVSVVSSFVAALTAIIGGPFIGKHWNEH